MARVTASAAVAATAEEPVGFERLRGGIAACTACAGALPLGPRPVVRGLPSARLLIISQAPGRLAHESGLSFNDASGDRLRHWLALDRAAFYDEARVAIVPVGFCYPGSTKNGGDLPPRRQCAPLWHRLLLAQFAAVELTVLVGFYAVRQHLPETRHQRLGAVLADWRRYRPGCFVLPHPSWRAIIWERRNPWFAAELLPELRAAAAAVLA